MNMSMSAQPEIGGREPLPIDVEAGKSYWCLRLQAHRPPPDVRRQPQAAVTQRVSA
jgi:hypothetical protein